eukprot:3544000-Amphidinium_carterae.1
MALMMMFVAFKSTKFPAMLGMKGFGNTMGHMSCPDVESREFTGDELHSHGVVRLFGTSCVEHAITERATKFSSPS